MEQVTSFYLEKNYVGCKSKRNHNYAQVQGQLAPTGLKWCDFCVFLSETNEMCVDRIEFDNEYRSKTLLPKLSSFYLNNALPFLLNKES